MPSGKLIFASANKSRARDHTGAVSLTVSFNSNCITEIPGREVDWINLISSKRLSWFSMTSVTKASTRSAEAPG